jgi:hypothetical protein
MTTLLLKEEAMIKKDDDKDHKQTRQARHSIQNNERKVSVAYIDERRPSYHSTPRNSLGHLSYHRTSSIPSISDRSRSSIGSELNTPNPHVAGMAPCYDDDDDEYDEKRDTGAVGWRIYWNYMVAAFGFIAPTLLLVFFLTTQGLLLGTDYWLSHW